MVRPRRLPSSLVRAFFAVFVFKVLRLAWRNHPGSDDSRISKRSALVSDYGRGAKRIKS